MVCMWFVCGNFDVFPYKLLVDISKTCSIWIVLIRSALPGGLKGV